MAVELEILPRQKRSADDEVCEPILLPEVDVEGSARVAAVAKALSDPIRAQLVKVLGSHAGQVCVCDLEPLFDVSQPTLSHHLKKLRDAGVVGVERRGLWAYYYVRPESLDELSAWIAKPE